PWAVLVASLLMTAAASWGVADSARTRDEARFAAATHTVHERIEGRLETYIALLRAGTGLFAASHHVTREEFRAYTQQLDIQQRYPGIQGIGFSLRVDPGSRDSLVAALRAEGLTDFRIWPDVPEAERHAIVYLEPMDDR